MAKRARTNRSKSKKASGSMISVLRNWVLPIVVGVLLAKGVTTWVATAAEVESGSMIPTLPYPTRLLIDKVSLEFGSPYRGEVVMFHHTAHSVPEDPLIKRIIGLPGDTVQIENGHVYVNGKELYEPYVSSPTTSQVRTFHVPAGHYFMLGDNRVISDDSRLWEDPYVPRANLIGRVDAVLWPLSVAHWVR